MLHSGSTTHPLRYNTIILLLASGLAGCATAPVAKPVAKTGTQAPVHIVATMSDTDAANADVGELMSLDVSKPITTVATNVFPIREQLDYRIALANDISLPVLEARNTPNGSTLTIIARVYNRGETTRTLDFICEVNDPKNAHQLLRIRFPAKKARDLRLRIDGPPDGSTLWFLVKDTKGTVTHAPEYHEMLNSIKID